MKIVKIISSVLVIGSVAFASIAYAQEGSRFSPIAEYLGLPEDVVTAAFGDQEPPDIAAVAAALEITPAQLEEALVETRKNAPPRPDE